MKAIETLKQIFPFHGHERTKVAANERAEEARSHLAEYALGAFCLIMFVALGPFAAIPAFFATFSIPKWLEEEKQARERA